MKWFGTIFVIGYLFNALSDFVSLIVTININYSFFRRAVSNMALYTIGDSLTIGVVVYICFESLRSKRLREEVKNKRRITMVSTSTNSSKREVYDSSSVDRNASSKKITQS